MAKHAKHALDPEVVEELAAGEETIESEEDEAALDADATAKATSGAHHPNLPAPSPSLPYLLFHSNSYQSLT